MKAVNLHLHRTEDARQERGLRAGRSSTNSEKLIRRAGGSATSADDLEWKQFKAAEEHEVTYSFPGLRLVITSLLLG